MRLVLSLLLLLHGLLHLIGFLKAFGREITVLKEPIGRPLGVIWLLAAVLHAAAAAALAWSPGSFWMLGTLGTVVSQAVVFTSWEDARWGTVGNLLALGLVAWACFSEATFLTLTF